MAILVKNYVLATIFVIVATSVQSATVEDYPEVELPGGGVIPGSGLGDTIDDSPCCFPKKWQANISSQTGMSGGRDGGKYRAIGNIAVFVDQDGKRIAAKGDEGGRFRNGSGGFIMIFGDQKADMYFFRVSDQKCKHKAIVNATFKDQCIPTNATGKAATLGPASGGLGVTAWSYRLQSPQDRRGLKIFVRGTIMVIQDKCLPVYSQDSGIIHKGRPRTGENINAIMFDQADDDQDDNAPGRKSRGGKFMSNTVFKSVKDSIEDPTVFTPPSYCNETASASQDLFFLEDDSFADILDRFVSF